MGGLHYDFLGLYLLFWDIPFVIYSIARVPRYISLWLATIHCVLDGPQQD